MKRKTIHSIRFGLAALIVGASALSLIPSRLFAQTRLDWPNYGNDLANTRFQNVDQINPGNVGTLKVAWVFHTGVLDPLAELQVSPIVIDGRMFVTDGHDDVFALDAATGKQIWAYKPFTMKQIEKFIVCCGRNNKGVAYGAIRAKKDRTIPAVFYGRLDNVVVALTADTGKVVWKKKLANSEHGYAINNAPQFVAATKEREALVIISLSGGEFEVQGQVFALRADNGKEEWHVNTTDPASFGGTGSARRGGAAVWNPPAIDEKLEMVYVVTGNAAPDILGEDRPGDNRFAASVVALDLNTGKPRWNFQAVHHDIWDYDSAQPAMLFDFKKGGTGPLLKAVGHCSKNGQYYILDRSTGAPIFPVTEVAVPPGPAFQNAAPTQPYSAVEPLTPLTFDPRFPPPTQAPDGERIVASPQYTPPDETLRVIVPGDDGGCEWNPAAFSPRNNLIYYGTRYEPTTFKTRAGNRERIPTPTGDLHLGSRFTNRVPGTHPYGIFGATDATTGTIRWRKEVPVPTKSGMTVAGNLVFFGESDGKFHAAHADTGATLFTFDPEGPEGRGIQNVGGAAASPVVYVVNGREFVVYAFGGNVPDRNNFANLDGQNPRAGAVGDAIIAFALPAP
jgi:quinohemoprotein ethanol dehydrogenase